MVSSNDSKRDSKNVSESDLGITVKKGDDFSEWYQQIILKAELVDYGPVSGCMIIRPYAYSIWESVQEYFDSSIKKLGVKNAYFPLLIPENLLTKEKNHVEGFAPEVAWVTTGGNSPLPERLAIRPTSETIMYDSYSKWIRSWRDLPLRLNQWCNVVRWEFKHPVPFLRTREFLWQEGHTAFATREEAVAEVFEILDLYASVFEDRYAVAVLKGIKSNNEKFAGADFTSSVETLFPNGKAIQAATSHLLGQNFAKAFEISFLDKDGNRDYVWQNSWGLTTRSIGIMLGIHGDDKGIVMPPRVAPVQIVVVPILFEDTRALVLEKCEELRSELSKKNIRVQVDDSDYRPGWKFNHWEMKGVPIRLELGPKDLAAGNIKIVTRYDGNKEMHSLETHKLVDYLKKTLDDIHHKMLDSSRKNLNDSIVQCNDLDSLLRIVDDKKIALAPFCNVPSCEESIKEKSGAKTLNSPLGQKSSEESGLKCVMCMKPATLFHFGRSY
ncbi:MAG TPA: proline--tRNA ligase [Alphaproteobacteria bacterium]|nr:proline--tRNA ligase [Alphaproteobacteria bacterium]